MSRLIRPLDPTDRDVAARLLAIQHASYAIEAALIGFAGIPALHESLEQLMAAPLRWLGAVDGGDLAGAIAFKADGETVDLDRLMIAPWAFRRGHGRALVEAVIERGPGPRFIVSTGTLNEPACRLYESLGFRPVGEREVALSVFVTDFELVLPGAGGLR